VSKDNPYRARITQVERDDTWLLQNAWEVKILKGGVWRKGRTFIDLQAAQNWAREQVFRYNWRHFVDGIVTTFRREMGVDDDE